MTEMTQPMSVGGVSCTHVFKNQAHRNREQNGGCQGLGMGEMGRGWSNGTSFQLQEE